jgi:hypothetical protein
VRLTAFFAVACVCGTAVWCVLSFIDAGSKITGYMASQYIVSAAIVGLAFTLKTWLGPIILTASLSWAVYTLLEHDKLVLLPIFQFIIDKFLYFAPSLSGPFYVVATMGFAILGSVYAAMKAARDVAL